jgi:hypothetical protein
MTGRSLVVATALWCAAAPALGQTFVNGNITTTRTWTAAGSPYIVTVDARVRFGSTLTIEPGVVVKFNANCGLSADAAAPPTWPVSSIVAVGTASDSIVFTSNVVAPTVGSWKTVSVVDSTSSSQFGHCTVRYAAQGLYFTRTDAPVDHCSFSDCQTGIYLFESGPPVTSCWITDCTSEGIRCVKNVAVPAVACSPTIYDCNISNLGAGAMNIRLQGYSDAPLEQISALGNWWGTDDPLAIAARIYDRNDDSAIHGEVDFTDYLSAPGVEQTSWGSIKALFRE